MDDIKCLVCGKPTKGGSWCSGKCVDIYEGNSPRGGANVLYGGESPDTRKDITDREEPYDEHNRGMR